MNSGEPDAGPALPVDAGSPVAPGIRLRLPAIPGVREEPAAALPPVDVSTLAGARITLLRGLEVPAAAAAAPADPAHAATAPVLLRIVCATAPSDRWAPGVEELVLDRATALARGAVAGAVERWDTAPRAWTGQRFEQRFEASARDGGATLAIRGLHLLGFAGEDRVVLLCTALCAEAVQDRAAGAAAPPWRCSPLLDAVALEGALASPPPPSLLARGILAAAEHPAPVAGLLALLAAAALALLLARRPRPRPVP